MRIKHKGKTGTLLHQGYGDCQLLMDDGEVVFTNMENVYVLPYEEDTAQQMCDLLCPMGKGNLEDE